MGAFGPQIPSRPQVLTAIVGACAGGRGCHNFVDGGGVSRTMVKYGDRDVRYVYIEAGHASSKRVLAGRIA